MEPIKITDATFKSEVIDSDVPVLVDFWAAWCMPCRMIASHIKEIAKEYKGKLKVGELNVDEANETAKAHNISSIPTLLVFKNGNLVDRIVGAIPKEMLKERIEKF